MKKSLLKLLAIAFSIAANNSNAQQWYPLNSGTTNHLRFVHFPASDTGFAVGYNGTIIKTTDAGNTWIGQNSGTSNQLYCVHFIDADTGYTSGATGVILKTTNSGANWTPLNSGTNIALNSVFFTTALTGYAVGFGGTILKTVDAGANWTAQSSGTTAEFYSVHFTDANTGYVVGTGGTIRKTTNGGSFWSALSSGTTNYLLAVDFIDANNGFAAGQSGVLVKTTDGGNTWSSMTSGVTHDLYSFYFINTNLGYLVGNAGTTGSILKYNGSSWSLIDSNTTSGLISVFFTTSSTGYAVGDGGIMLKTCNLTANAGNDTTICSGTSAAIGGTPAATGGTPPYSYNWSPSNSLSASNVENPVATPGSYTVYSLTVTDNNGCTNEDSMNMFVAPSPDITITSTTNVTCNGSNNGAISTQTSGGPSPYTYNWSNGATTQNLSNMPAGNYFVTVTGGNGCTDIDSVLLTEPSLVSNSFSNNDVSCYGGNNGSISLTTTGGVSPYSYIWDNGQTTSSATGLSAGFYNVTVTDNNGCSVVNGATISQPPNINISLSPFSPLLTCNGGSNGEIGTVVSGGMPPYSYLWSNGATTYNIQFVPAGTYTVSVTDANGCLSTSSGTINEPSPIIITPSQNNELCNESNNGSASLSVSGGITPYVYLWSNGASGNSVNNLSAGTYTVSVTDNNNNNGCTVIDSVVITQPASIAYTTLVNSASCYGVSDGAITIYATGGNPPYTYQWIGGNFDTATGLTGGGTYYITVTDINNCSPATGYDVIPPATSFSGGISSTDVSCFGGNDGTATASGSGGTTPYSYLWFNGNTAQTIFNLTAGSYNVTISDANGCGNLVYSATIGQPTAALSATTSSADISCNGGNDGTATANGTGGTSPYNYQWSNGATTSSVFGLPSSVYFVTVTDDNGCTAEDSVLINEPPATVVNAGMDFTFCANNSAATLNGAVNGTTTTGIWSTSGTGNFSPDDSTLNATYTPSSADLSAGSVQIVLTSTNNGICNAETDMLILTYSPAPIVNAGIDQTLCENNPDVSLNGIVSGGTTTGIWATSGTGSFSNGTDLNAIYIPSSADLSAGSVILTLTSTNNGNCFATVDNTTITFLPAPTVNAGADVSVCDGASTILAASGAISYLWSTTETTSSITVTPSVSSGYSVTGTDANGCSANDSVFVIVNPNPTATAYTVNTISCNGGSDGEVAVAAGSGTTPYSYLWNTGATTDTINGLIADTFNVTVTDANGCWVESYTIITEPTAIVVNAGSNTQINEGASAAYTANATGGAGGYSYLWTFGETSQSVLVTPPATTVYGVTVSDANGCTGTDSWTITVIQINFSISGTIYNQAHDTSLNNGTVYLLQYDSLVPIAPVDSFILGGGNGDYVFNNHPSDQYIILFKPNNAIYPDAIPTYYGDTTSWLGAQIINLTSDTGGIDISTREIPQLFGTGFISGFIQFGIGSGKTGNGNVVPFGDPVPGIDVELEQIPGGIVRHTTTNDSGMFSFSNLPINSNYKLYVDIPGLPMDSTYEVFLSASDSTANNLDYVVDTTSGSGGIFIGFPLGIWNLEFGIWDFNIFPNPNDGKFTLRSSVFRLPSSIKVYNVLGEIVYSTILTTNNQQLLTNLNSGIYLVQLISESGIITKRIVIE